MNKKVKEKNIILELLPYIIIVLVVLLIKTFVVAPIRVNGASMDNTLRNKDIMLLDKISYRFEDIKRFDIVVVKHKDDYLIKRVIGMPGEKIESKENEIYINDKKLDCKFKYSYTDDFAAFVPEGNYFLLGDNRVVSLDSREFGSFGKEDILGKTSLVIFPFERFGFK